MERTWIGEYDDENGEIFGHPLYNPRMWNYAIAMRECGVRTTTGIEAWNGQWKRRVRIGNPAVCFFTHYRLPSLKNKNLILLP